MPDEERRSPLDAFRAPDDTDDVGGDTEELDEVDAVETIEDEPDAGSGEVEDIDPAFYAHGGIALSEAELQVLGELQGRRVLMVGAGNGEDAASLVNLGATLTVVDDEESIEPPRALLAEAGLEAEFFIDAPMALSVDLRNTDFDLVYSGFGAIDWMDDIGGWAGGIADCLKSGGRLVVYDEHPFAYTFAEADDHLRVAYSYFGAGDVDDESDANEEESDDGPTWTLGDIVTALGANGLATISLLELRESNRFESPLDRLGDASYDEVARVPGAFLLVAVKLPEHSF
jgi:SAM-dependent methyltransferase